LFMTFGGVLAVSDRRYRQAVSSRKQQKINEKLSAADNVA